MKSIKTIIFICFISITLCLYGQNGSKKFVFGISAGLEKSFLKDQAFSPLNYSHFNTSYNVRFVLRKKKYAIPAFIDFSMGNIHTSIDNFTSSFVQGSADIGYLHNIFPEKASNNQAGIYMGMGISSFLQYLDYQEQESFSFFILHGADFKLTYLHAISTNSLIEGHLSAFIAGLLVRPPYAGFDEELEENQSKPLRLITNGNFVTLNNAVSLRNRLIFRYSLSDRFTVLCTYVFKYSSISADYSKGYRNAENIILLGIDFKF